jgi:TadE-like protein
MCSSEPAAAGAASGDRGYVTAEAAVVLPALALFTAMLLWGIMAVAGQIQCVDAARAGARAAARSEPDSRVRAAALSAAPRGAEIALERAGDLVRVRVTARSLGPGSLAGALSADLRAEAVALAEDTVGAEAR